MRDGRAISTRRAERALQPQLWLWSGTSSQKLEKLFLSHLASAAPGTLQRAGPAFGGAEGSKESQAGLAGSGSGHNLAMVRQKAALRKCFFPWIVFNKHLCVRQSNTQSQDQSRHTCRQRAPTHTARPGMLCLEPCTPGSSAGL